MNTNTRCIHAFPQDNSVSVKWARELVFPHNCIELSVTWLCMLQVVKQTVWNRLGFAFHLICWSGLLYYLQMWWGYSDQNYQLITIYIKVLLYLSSASRWLVSLEWGTFLFLRAFDAFQCTSVCHLLQTHETVWKKKYA